MPRNTRKRSRGRGNPLRCEKGKRFCWHALSCKKKVNKTPANSGRCKKERRKCYDRICYPMKRLRSSTRRSALAERQGI